MAACLLRRCFLAAILVVLAPGIGCGQTLNIDRSLKNLPTEPVPPVEPTPPPAVQGSTPAPPVAETRVEPQRLRPKGTYTNKFSGVPFPNQVGDFTRLNMDMYDGEGRNIGAVYEKKQRGNLVCVVNAFSGDPFPARVPPGGAAAIFEAGREKLSWQDYPMGARADSGRSRHQSARRLDRRFCRTRIFRRQARYGGARAAIPFRKQRLVVEDSSQLRFLPHPGRPGRQRRISARVWHHPGAKPTRQLIAYDKLIWLPLQSGLAVLRPAGVRGRPANCRACAPPWRWRESRR